MAGLARLRRADQSALRRQHAGDAGNGRRSDVGARDVEALAAQLGLPASATRRVLHQATERVELWLPLLDDLPYDLGRRRKLRRVVEQRRARLAPT